MPRGKTELSLTKREMDVMTILWESNTPLVASEITKMDDSLNINTVQAVIRKLLDKKYIEVADIVYSGTVLTRSYRPTLSKKEMTVQRFIRQFQENDKVSIPNLVTTLLKHEKNEREVIEELEVMLEERKKLLKQKEE
ncbi:MULTISPECIES: BlaI/MecI/CopY family transcriptional regulator [Clostridia]|uniref:Penicillinase repressor n=1 Tax=Lacrimispora celerecrescens TaxID=29354 RepID=A0A084JP69_9FIRM|nr:MULTISPECIES: BlaI/MecI/CopY family transcriptional regulator [Clostridia]KEZ90753.1 penicillinase repressor [Lacrimispora celerecrescens]MBW4848072.1 BlaI/MecI/CopY family transcriptional regulator [Lachnospiraceae bacterium]MSS09376.1 BlaI/MecI/CopY family transcriptional regulator [Clostridium sp. WB02_MRS01]